MPLSTRIVGFDDLTAHDIAAWRDLVGRSAEPNMFFEPEVLRSAVRHLARPGSVRLAVVEDAAGRWLACAPVTRVARWGRVPLPCLAVWGHDFCGLEVPLVDREHLRAAVAELLRAMRSPWRGVFAAFTQVPADGPFRAAVTEVLGGPEVEVARYERAALRRRPSFTYLDGMGSKRRGELARKRRRLEERHTGVAVEDMSDDPEGLATFLALEASGWKGREGTALASEPGHAAFFRETCEGLQEAGRLEIIALVADGRPIAMKCNGLAGDRVYGLKQAYDESMAAYSPGRLLDVDTMRSFHAREGAAVFDTIGSATSASLNSTWPDRLVISTLLVPARGPLGSLAARLLRGLLGRRPGSSHPHAARRSTAPLAPGASSGR